MGDLAWPRTPPYDSPRADERAERALSAKGWEGVVADLAEKHANDLERWVDARNSEKRR